MTRIERPSAKGLCLLAWMALLSIGDFADVGAGSLPYPFVVKGPKPLIGQRIDRLSAHSWDGSRWRAIPLQIDEVNARGDYVLEGGLPFTKDSDDGVFDDNDELVIDGQDLGQDFSLEQVSQDVRQQGQWKLTFGRWGTVLIRAEANPYRSEFAPRVRFDRAKGWIDTPHYSYRFHEQHPVLLGRVAMKQKDGRERQLIDSATFRIDFRTPWWVPNFSLAANDFSSAIESWRSGPLRTIVAVGAKFKNLLSLLQLHVFSELVFYANRFQIPTVVEFPFDSRSLLEPGSGLVYAMSFPADRDWSVKAEIDSLASTPEQGLKRGWKQGQGFSVHAETDSGRFRLGVLVDAQGRSAAPPPSLIRRAHFDDPTLYEAWPWLEEMEGDVGFFTDFSRVPAGTYQFALDLILQSKAHENLVDEGSVDPRWQAIPGSQ